MTLRHYIRQYLPVGEDALFYSKDRLHENAFIPYSRRVYDTLAQAATRQGQSAEHEALLWLARHGPVRPRRPPPQSADFPPPCVRAPFRRMEDREPECRNNRADDADLARYRAGGSDSLMLHRSALSCCVLVPIKPIRLRRCQFLVGVARCLRRPYNRSSLRPGRLHEGAAVNRSSRFPLFGYPAGIHQLCNHEPLNCENPSRFSTAPTAQAPAFVPTLKEVGTTESCRPQDVSILEGDGPPSPNRTNSLKPIQSLNGRTLPRSIPRRRRSCPGRPRPFPGNQAGGRENKPLARRLVVHGQIGLAVAVIIARHRHRNRPVNSSPTSPRNGRPAPRHSPAQVVRRLQRYLPGCYAQALQAECKRFAQHCGQIMVRCARSPPAQACRRGVAVKPWPQHFHGRRQRGDTFRQSEPCSPEIRLPPPALAGRLTSSIFSSI